LPCSRRGYAMQPLSWRAVLHLMWDTLYNRKIFSDNFRLTFSLTDIIRTCGERMVIFIIQIQGLNVKKCQQNNQKMFIRGILNSKFRGMCDSRGSIPESNVSVHINTSKREIHHNAIILFSEPKHKHFRAFCRSTRPGFGIGKETSEINRTKSQRLNSERWPFRAQKILIT
jgi:hypothetical protein